MRDHAACKRIDEGVRKDNEDRDEAAQENSKLDKRIPRLESQIRQKENELAGLGLAPQSRTTRRRRQDEAMAGVDASAREVARRRLSSELQSLRAELRSAVARRERNIRRIQEIDTNRRFWDRQAREAGC